MKTRILSLILITIFTATSIAQSTCSKYLPFSEGVKTQVTTYDKKGKVAAIINTTVTGISNSNGTETASIHSILSDEKGKLIAESNYDVLCKGDAVSIDFKSLMNPQVMEQFGKMDYELTGTDIIIPNNLSVGQTLPDANMQMKLNMSGMNMNMNVSLKDRKVIGEESITTPAGTFNCFVISYNLETKMGVNQNGSAKQWLAEGVGMVKQEDYNSSGKVTSSTLLTAFSN